MKKKVKLEEDYGYTLKEVTRIDSTKDTNSDTANNIDYDTNIFTSIETIIVTQYVT